MSKVDELIAANRREREESYRRLALKLYPHVCGRCAREFSGKRLSELTVHHRDHNHDNNPADGSNWELLCLYCHAKQTIALPDQRSNLRRREMLRPGCCGVAGARGSSPVAA